MNDFWLKVIEGSGPSCAIIIIGISVYSYDKLRTFLYNRKHGIVYWGPFSRLMTHFTWIPFVFGVLARRDRRIAGSHRWKPCEECCFFTKGTNVTTNMCRCDIDIYRLRQITGPPEPCNRRRGDPTKCGMRAAWFLQRSNNFDLSSSSPYLLPNS